MNVYSVSGQLVRIVHQKLENLLGKKRFAKIDDIKNNVIHLKDGRKFEIKIEEVK